MEVELGTLFVYCQLGAALSIALQEMEHPHTHTPVIKEIATVYGFVNENIIQCRYRDITVHFYWVNERVRQVHYLVQWRTGK